MPPTSKDTPSFDNPSTDAKPLDDDISARLKAVEAQLAAARAALPLTVTPLHGAGPGDEVAETWSLADQEAAKRP
jgi:hypothetical protein